MNGTNNDYLVWGAGLGGGQQQLSEPGMLPLFGLAVLMMGFLRRRKRIV